MLEVRQGSLAKLIKCDYCGSLRSFTPLRCENCGGPPESILKADQYAAMKDLLGTASEPIGNQWRFLVLGAGIMRLMMSRR